MSSVCNCLKESNLDWELDSNRVLWYTLESVNPNCRCIFLKFPWPFKLIASYRGKNTPSLVELNLARSLDLFLSPTFWPVWPTLDLVLFDKLSLGPLIFCLWWLFIVIWLVFKSNLLILYCKSLTWMVLAYFNDWHLQQIKQQFCVTL
jgi:hypothetical protein